MSDFATCLAWTLHNEDSQLTYEATPDSGGFAIAGINSHVWPASYAYIAGLPVTERAAAVSIFYRCKFWNRYFEQLTSDELAKRVFDFSVNAGSIAAVKCLQRATNQVNSVSSPMWTPMVIDGIWGPDTIKQAESALGEVVQAFQQQRSAYYKIIVAAQPQDAKYLDGWLTRALK